MPELSAKTGVLREAVLAGELVGADLIAAKREFYLKAAVTQPGEWTDAATGRHFEVVGREADGDLVTFFVRAWTAADKKTQLAFGRPGRAVGVERFRFQNIPCLTDDPLGGFEECGTDPETGLIQTRPKLVEDPLLVARELIRQQVGLTARIDPGADFKATGRTVTTFYPAAGNNSPIDGTTYRSGSGVTFSSIRSAAGTGTRASSTFDYFCGLITGASANSFTDLHRGIFCFNTAAIGSDPINIAVISLFGYLKPSDLGQTDLCIVTSNPASTSALANADHAAANYGTTTLASVSTSSFSTSGYNDMEMNGSGIAAINKSGISKLGARIEWDRANSFGGIWSGNTETSFYGYFADQTGTTNDPKLTVTHAVAAATGPGLLMAAAGG